jgi:YD repeat-containing protein
VAGVLCAAVTLMAVGATPGSVTYQYDAAGRLIGVINTNDSTTAYTLDAAGNRKQVSVTADTTKPPAPTGLTGTAVSSTQVNLTWSAQDGSYSLAGYYIFRGGSQIGSSSGTSYSDTTTTCSSSPYSYTVESYDTASPANVSTASSAWSVTPPITLPPTVPTGLTKTSATSSQVVIGWTASTDPCSAAGGSVAGYKVYRSTTSGQLGTLMGSATTTSYTDSTVAASTTYYYAAESYDNQTTPNLSAASTALTVATPGPPPSVPTGVTATAYGPIPVSLSWTASTDTGGPGLSGYKIYRGGTQIGTSTTTTYTDSTTSSAGGTAYSYTVAAYDTAGNTSAQSTAANVTTPTVYQITLAGGSVLTYASTLYTASVTCNVGSKITICTYSLKQAYGSDLQVATASISYLNTTTPIPIVCQSGTASTSQTGYTVAATPCEITATPAVYGH